MDSNDLEQERGITIYAKNTSIVYKGTKINIVDTPGHADFGSEVERVLRSIDCVLLVVDAQEGSMPQTRFVLKKSLEVGHKPIVVINKIDTTSQRLRPMRVHEEVLELFFELGANEEQLDFVTVYAVGRGVAMRHLLDERKNMDPLLDVVLEKVPSAVRAKDAPLKAQVFNLGYDDFLGRMAIARVYEGTMKDGQNVFAKKPTRLAAVLLQKYLHSKVLLEKCLRQNLATLLCLLVSPNIYIGDTITDNPRNSGASRD